MVIKIFRAGCDVEAHEVPPFVGLSTTTEGVHAGEAVIDSGSETASEADRVSDVVERFRYTPEGGGVLERRITRQQPGGGHETGCANGTQGMVIVPPGDAAVRRIDVDGEQVWPEDAASDRVAELEAMLERMLAEQG